MSANVHRIARRSDGDIGGQRLRSLYRPDHPSLGAVLVRAQPQLRESLAGLGPVTLFRACAALPDTDTTTTNAATVTVLRGLAHRILTLTDKVKTLNNQLTAALKVCAPKLLERHGVGPDTAAALLITAGDNPQRLTGAAAFAALCGVNPIEASSGKTIRHRLNRGGDRRANSALYTIVLTRLGRVPPHPASTPTAAPRKENPPKRSSAA